ncbi:hypothetical protein [Promicromonospora sp. NPDC050880]|uniref:hypothetical protein n=1 Tax=Promicromonospora sp. NPDC050880 TaxID=3364406 RepID=UPI0037BA7814
MRTRRSLAAAAGTLMAALLLTGCTAPGTTPDAGSGTTAGTGDPAQPTPDAQAYAQCMRDHGVEVSDPDPETGLPQFADSVDPSSAAVQDAMEQCQDLLPAGIRGETSGQDMDVYLAFAECMRDNGLPDFPDPQPGPEGLFGDTGIDRADPTYQQAAEACGDILSGE